MEVTLRLLFSNTEKRLERQFDVSQTIANVKTQIYEEWPKGKSNAGDGNRYYVGM